MLLAWSTAFFQRGAPFGAAFAAAAVEPSSFERLFDGYSVGESLLAAVSAGGATPFENVGIGGLVPGGRRLTLSFRSFEPRRASARQRSDAGGPARLPGCALVERFDIEAFPDFSAK